MGKTKIAITLDGPVLARLDRLVQAGVFPNRSQGIETAVTEKIARLEHRRLAAECAKLDPDLEQALADEGLGADAAVWPEY